MNKTICLHLDLNYLDSSDTAELDRQYQNGLKKVLKGLYANPNFQLAISIPGVVLEYYSEKFPEAITLLNELVGRSQIEMLGGGYYAPALPLLYPSDRSGQIEKMTSVLRGLIGKRPRGLSLYGSIWDISLIQPLKSCGFEYIFLDDSLSSGQNAFYPVVVSEYGKSIKVLFSKSYLAPVEGETFLDWNARLSAHAGKDLDEKNNILSIELNLDNILFIVEKKFLAALLSNDSGVKLETPQQWLKSCSSYSRCHIPGGMKKIEANKKSYDSIYSYLYDNPGAMHLYERMIYLNMLISQSQGKDKMRKKAAKEKLWEAQCGIYFLSVNSAMRSATQKRQTAYRNLNEAERILREHGQFVEALTTYDYNNDGFNEYVYQAENFNAVISPKGGRICDLNMLSNGFNYTDHYFFEGETKENKFFIESLSEKEPDRTSSGDNELNFGNVLFSEKKFDGKRKEIVLESESIFSQLKMPVSLQKKIIASSTGFMIQYILKNISPFHLKAFFAVTLNLVQTDFSNKQGNQYQLELIQDGNRIKVSNDKCNLKKGVSMLQILDTTGKIALLLEPNEEAGFIYEHESPKTQSEDACNDRIRFYWNVDLASGRAMEKTVNFMLIPSRKNKSQK